jgi:hypothetical protein
VFGPREVLSPEPLRGCRISELALRVRRIGRAGGPATVLGA